MASLHGLHKGSQRVIMSHSSLLDCVKHATHPGDPQVQRGLHGTPGFARALFSGILMWDPVVPDLEDPQTSQKMEIRNQPCWLAP